MGGINTDGKLRVAYSVSGRGLCRGRGCNKKIAKDELRVCNEVLVRFGGKMRPQTMFYHLDCFPQAVWKKFENVDMEGLRLEDSLKVLKLMGGKESGSSASSSTPAASKTASTGQPKFNTTPGHENNASRVYDPRLLPVVEAGALLKSPEVGLEERFVDMLMPFQRQGVAFAVKKCNGRALIGDEMGLGKTVQAIGFALAFRKEWPLLIITPSSVKLNWADELEQWAPTLQPGEINVIKSRSFPGDLKKPVTIITYGMFARGSKVVDAIEAQKFRVVVVDESHYLKNSTAIRTQKISPILKQARRVALLSGTPALARPIELWTQVHALRPDIFPKYREFTNRFCNPTRRPWGMDYNGASNLEELHEKLQGLLVRRQKRNVLRQLPPKRRQLLRLDVAPGAACMKEVKGLMARLRDVDMNNLLAAAEEGGMDRELYREVMSARSEQRQTLMKLYKATGEAKVAAAAEYVSSTAESGEKLIVFAHHLDVLDALQTELTRKKVSLIRIDGSVSTTDRHAYVKRFQDPNSGVTVALLGLTSAGQGITLTAASTVIFVEMHWTPGVLVQAEDRAHRIGQVNAVNIIYLTVRGTLDDIVWPMVRRKLDTVGKALDGVQHENMFDRTQKTLMDANHVDLKAAHHIEEDESGHIGNVDGQTSVNYPKGDVRSWFSTSGTSPLVMTPKRKVDREADIIISETEVSDVTPLADRTPRRKHARLRESNLGEPAINEQVSPSAPSEPDVFDLTMSNDAFETFSTPAKKDSFSTKKPSKVLMDDFEAFGTPTGKVSSTSKATKVSNDRLGAFTTPARQTSTSGSKLSKATPFTDVDLHDEIEDDDSEPVDSAQEALAKSLHFSVSGNTGRIFLFDSKKEPYGINFAANIALEKSWQDVKDLPSMLQDSKPVQRAVERFARQWESLRSAERNALVDQVIRPPLLPLVQDLYAKRKAQGLCFERYMEKSPGVNITTCDKADEGQASSSSAEIDVQAEKVPTCIECSKPIPEDLLKLQVTTLCSFDCHSKYRIKLSGSAIRRQLFSLEHGICQVCNENAQALYEKVKAVTSAERYQMLVGTKFKPTKQRLENPRAGDFWQADHIQAVSLGGGQACMLNFRTLCCPCHERETKALMRVLKNQKLEKAAQGSKDIRGFFSVAK
mmetsp:Transcript_457/g.1105  ORF Transcript_457/g.1105 Transcript_457/m.1105 type:complete len:1145 (-) Transcript_457:220-3654(-)